MGNNHGMGNRHQVLIVPTNAIMAATEAINSAAAATSSSFPSLSLSLASFLSISSSCGSAPLLSARPSVRPSSAGRHCRPFSSRAPAKYHHQCTTNQPTNLFGRSVDPHYEWIQVDIVRSVSFLAAEGREERDSIAENGPARLMMAHPILSLLLRRMDILPPGERGIEGEGGQE